MQDNIRDIFTGNIKLLEQIDKAVILFREGRYDIALEMIAETGDGINTLCEAILNNREYFKLVSTDSVAEMLQGILDAKQRKDYVLLADLYEMQLTNFICSVQELIIQREDFLSFDEEAYGHNIVRLEEALDRGMELLADEGFIGAGDRSDADSDRIEDELARLRANRNALLEAPLMPEQLLDMGYSVEFTSCGLMTLKAPRAENEGIYLHSNDRIGLESFLLARSWVREGVDTYIIYGFGMGYHVAALRALAPGARIIVFESDINVLKLYAAFANTEESADRAKGLYMVYDPELSLIEQRIAGLKDNERAYVHFPSFRRIVPGEGLKNLVPWCSLIEEC